MTGERPAKDSSAKTPLPAGFHGISALSSAAIYSTCQRTQQQVSLARSHLKLGATAVRRGAEWARTSFFEIRTGVDAREALDSRALAMLKSSLGRRYNQCLNGRSRLRAEMEHACTGVAEVVQLDSAASALGLLQQRRVPTARPASGTGRVTRRRQVVTVRYGPLSRPVQTRARHVCACTRMNARRKAIVRTEPRFNLLRTCVASKGPDARMLEKAVTHPLSR